MTPTNMKCPVCGATELTHDTRDLSYAYKGETTVISAVRGDFCRVCSESILDSVESDRVMQHMRTFSKQTDTARSRAWTKGEIFLMTDHFIRDDGDHQMVRQTVSVLVDSDPQRGTADAARLEVLGTLLQTYEVRHFPLELPDSVEVIQFHKERNS